MSNERLSGWEAVNEANNGSRQEVEFIKLKVGTTKIRIIDSEPKANWKHWVQNANNGKGLSVVCPGQDTCPICKENAKLKKAGLKPKYNTSRTFAMNAIEDGKIKILEKGAGFFKDVYNIQQQMGELKGYELNITRTGSGMNDTKYTILPQYPPQALTDEKEWLDKRIDLEDYFKELTPEEITNLMNGGGLKKEESGDDLTPDFTLDSNPF